MADCLFCKIVTREIPGSIVYEDDRVLAFNDINPQAPTHVLLVPKRHIASLNDLTPDDDQIVGELARRAAAIARDRGIAAGPDALMMLRIQLERMSAAYFPTEREYSRRYGLDARRLDALPDGSIVLHPGPMNRGLEISAEAADSPRSTVLEQVANGVSVRMAVLYLLLSGARTDSEKEDLR